MGSLQFIASANTNSGATNSPITFTNISQSYTDLYLLFSIRLSTGQIENIVNITFNNTSSGYSQQQVLGQGISTSASFNSGLGGSDTYVSGGSTNAGNFTNSFFYIQNYTSTTNYKTTLFTSNNTPNNSNNRTTQEGVFQGGGTNAITRLDIVSASGQFAQYCTFYLYGINWTP